MDYDEAVQHYLVLRDQNKEIETESERRVAENKEKMEKLGVFIQLKAEKDGLKQVNTKYGTVFWTVGDRCTLSNAEQYMNFVIANEAWELVEKRASKVGVRDWIKNFKQVPPGVDYVTFKQINVRKGK